jgi:large repetitive protein
MVIAISTAFWLNRDSQKLSANIVGAHLPAAGFYNLTADYDDPSQTIDLGIYSGSNYSVVQGALPGGIVLDGTTGMISAPNVPGTEFIEVGVRTAVIQIVDAQQENRVTTRKTILVPVRFDISATPITLNSYEENLWVAIVEEVANQQTSRSFSSNIPIHTSGNALAIDGEGSITYSITEGRLPSGFSFDPNTAVFSVPSPGTSRIDPTRFKIKIEDKVSGILVQEVTTKTITLVPYIKSGTDTQRLFEGINGTTHFSRTEYTLNINPGEDFSFQVPITRLADDNGLCRAFPVTDFTGVSTTATSSSCTLLKPNGISGGNVSDLAAWQGALNFPLEMNKPDHVPRFTSPGYLALGKLKGIGPEAPREKGAFINHFAGEFMNGRSPSVLTPMGNILTLTINVLNAPPVASDLSVRISEDSSIDILYGGLITDLNSNDNPIINTALLTPPANGTLSNITDTGVTYTPDPNFFGMDSFTYRATDGEEESNIGIVTIDVSSGNNDAPDAVDPPPPLRVNETDSITIPILDYAIDPDGNDDLRTFLVREEVIEGSLNLEAPLVNEFNTDHNRALWRGQISSDTLIFTPTRFRTSSDKTGFVNIYIEDSLSQDTQKIEIPISIVSVNEAPFAEVPTTDITISEVEDYTHEFRLNDPDGFFDVRSVRILGASQTELSNPRSQSGLFFNAIGTTVDIMADSGIAIAPGRTANIGQRIDFFHAGATNDITVSPVSYTGDSPKFLFFYYDAEDNLDLVSNQFATLNVTITPINRQPILDSFQPSSVQEGFTETFTITPQDPDISTLSLSIDSSPSLGNITAIVCDQPPLTAECRFTYTPLDDDINGTESFNIIIDDGETWAGNNQSAPILIEFEVVPVNDIPVTNDITLEILDSREAQIDMNLIANDDKDTLYGEGGLHNAGFQTVPTPLPHGDIFVDSQNGIVNYIRTEFREHTHTFEFEIQDIDGAFSSNVPRNSIITLNFNSTPTFVSISPTSIPEDTSHTFDLFLNDLEEEDILTFSIDPSAEPSFGTISGETCGIGGQPGHCQFLYTTNNNDDNGGESFSIIINDDQTSFPNHTSDPIPVTFNIDPVNDLPTTRIDFVPLNSSRTTLIHVLDNDDDVKDDRNASIGELIRSSVSTAFTSATPLRQPTQGTVTANSPLDGIITYQPFPTATGTDSFEYTVTDNQGGVSLPTLVTLTINHSPTARDDTVNLQRTEQVEIDILANDDDAVDGSLAHSTVTIRNSLSLRLGTIENINSTTGSITYRPDPSLSGIETIEYTVQDNQGAVSNIATVTITVNGRPLAKDRTIQINEGESITNFNLITNNTTFTNDNIEPRIGTLVVDSVLINEQTNNATLTNNLDGTITYIPFSGFSGQETFTYTIEDAFEFTPGSIINQTSNTASITIHINDKPRAFNDPQAGTVFLVNHGEQLPISTDSLISNDTDLLGINGNPGGIDRSSIQVGNVRNGTVSLSPDFIHFSADRNSSDTTNFTYTVADHSGFRSAQATVAITINARPVAVDDSIPITNEDTPVTFNFTINDSDADGIILPAQVTILTQPNRGTLFNNNNGTYTYTPDASQDGNDEFTYEIKDNRDNTFVSQAATVTIPINDQPVASGGNLIFEEDDGTPNSIQLLASDQNGTADISTFQITTIPDVSFLSLNRTSGAMSNPMVIPTLVLNTNTDGIAPLFLEYTVTDARGLVSSPGRIEIEITAITDTPIANPDTALTTENNFVDIPVLTNDSAIEDTFNTNSIIITVPLASTTAATNLGTAIPQANGSIIYTPNNDIETNHTVTFSYTVADNSGNLSNPAQVTVHISAQNDAPVMTNNTIPGVNNEAQILIFLSATDADPPPNSISFSIVNQPTDGFAQINGNRITYFTPSRTFFGDVTFQVKPSDGIDDGDPVDITIPILQNTDVDGSGGISSNDVMTLLRELRTEASQRQLLTPVSDTNNDGLFNMNDVIEIIRSLIAP